MKKTFIATVALSLGMVGIITTPTTTQAKTKPIPTSIRGKWRSKDPYTHKYNYKIIGKYTIIDKYSGSGKTYWTIKSTKSKKYQRLYMGHLKNGYYKFETQFSTFGDAFKRIKTKKHRVALRSYASAMDPYARFGKYTYWYHY